MKRVPKAVLLAAFAGGMACLLSLTLLPWVLERSGMSPRGALGVILHVDMYVSPFGLLASLLVVLGQELQLPDWCAPIFLIVIPTVANAIAYGLLALAIRWTRVHARIAFLVLSMAPFVYWSFLGLAELAH